MAATQTPASTDRTCSFCRMLAATARKGQPLLAGTSRDRLAQQDPRGQRVRPVRPAQQDPRGPAGPQGPAGLAASAVTASAVFTITDYTDTGICGTECSGWATDDLTRTVTITQHSEVSASVCGNGATHCWFYTGTVADSGSFTTSSGAFDPAGGTNGTINGTLSGTVNGGGDVEFYASAAPAAPATLAYTGSTLPSQVTGGTLAGILFELDMTPLFFPSGTVIQNVPSSGNDGRWVDFAWTYDSTTTCETWGYSFTPQAFLVNETGSINGTDECS
jgi:hypothetical protein